MIPIHIKNENKFKTVTIALKFKAPIDDKTITERALLSKILTKSTADFPTEQSLYDYLSDLYGAHLSSYVSKQKTAHIITISIEFINDKYIDEQLFDRCSQLLADAVWRPYLQNQAFDDQKVTQEKQLLAARFDHIKDNKAQASFQSMLQEMFAGQSYRFPSIGFADRLIDVTPHKLYQAYRSMLEQDEKSLYVIGDIDDTVRRSLEEKFNFSQQSIKLHTLDLPVKSNPSFVTEHATTSQARINMGMTVPVTYATPEYFSFIVMNQMYGGDATSLLFMNVREKLSLAYQIHSQIDARLGLMYVIAGVQNVTYKETVDTILEQLDLIKKGDFSTGLLSTAKKMLVSHRKENLDRPRGWIEQSYASTFDATVLTTDDWIKGIESVTKQDVMQIANEVNVQTIYCLAEEVKA
ncbi:insulinase family protein [Macrococcus hajekii]|uniref:Insulinase family protein n=1 Tax=Macrococcus hajekii TaxID=198482 RepID=A0A4R6BMS8_9STAP|nr:pitrilysin family protein [Macrococcus hajekii]TDM03143.1 insulinase family protein [Macrococcus hajekii]GGA96310.1 peptidase M16 [Macrococcus hajekii]